MILPFPVLLRSQIQKRKKAVLLGLFALGVFITVIQIIRIQTVNRLVNHTDSAPLILWSTVENNIGIIVACVPTLAPLVKYFRERSHGERSKTASYANKTSRDIGSHYAMATWKGGIKGGHQPLESNNDDKDNSSFEGHIKGGSTEMILESTFVGASGIGGLNNTDHNNQAGITKMVEVSITVN